MMKGGSKPRALRPLPALSSSAIVIEEIVTSGQLPFSGLHDTPIGSKSPQKCTRPPSTSNDTVPPIFSPGIIPLKYQVPKSLHNRAQNHNGGSQRKGLSWLHTSPVIQQTLECRQLVFTPRCFLAALITLGAIFLLVSDIQIVEFADLQLRE